MPRRASPYLYKVSGVRKRHTLRTGNTCTSKHVTIATTLGEAARDAEMAARASLGLSPLHPPPLSISFQTCCASCDAHCSTEHQPRIKRASHERRLIASLAWQGVLQSAKIVHRVTDARGAVSGRPSGRGRPSSMALLSFAKQALRVKNFWKD